MRRIALPNWQGRLSPVFDVAQQLMVVEMSGRQEHGRQFCSLSAPDAASRAKTLLAHDVDVLICGAISQSLERAVTAAGIGVIAGICGDVDRVLRAYALGRLEEEESLHLPGQWRPLVSAGPGCRSRS